MNSELGEGTYDFVAIPERFLTNGRLGSDAISNALIYRPDHVQIAEGTSPATLSLGYTREGGNPAVDLVNRPAIAATFEMLDRGDTFTAVSAHFKSKGSIAQGEGNVDAFDGQGNSNGQRVSEDQAVIDWLSGDPTNSGSTQLLLVGDLNAYTLEDPVQLLEASGLTDLAPPGRFTYQFKGQFGALDHAMASDSLLAQVTGSSSWNVNSPEPDAFHYANLYYHPDIGYDFQFGNRDNVTHLLVQGFTGANGDDLDFNDDGELDASPWSSVLDSVALIESCDDNQEKVYATVQLGADSQYVPAAIARNPDATGDFTVGSYSDLSGDTPGEFNVSAPSSISGVLINELRIDQPGSDTNEFVELIGTPNFDLDGYTYLVIGDGSGGSGVIESVTDLSGLSLDASGLMVLDSSLPSIDTFFEPTPYMSSDHDPVVVGLFPTGDEVFRHGVASGDPYDDSVILWTRYAAEATPFVMESSKSVTWEISTTVDFSDVVDSGVFTTSADRDWTVKVEAQGLEPGQDYSYRFGADGLFSAVGQTNTLPTDTEQVRLAVFACSYLAPGSCETCPAELLPYGKAAEIDADRPYDAMIHLGDYIYENGNQFLDPNH